MLVSIPSMNKATNNITKSGRLPPNAFNDRLNILR